MSNLSSCCMIGATCPLSVVVVWPLWHGHLLWVIMCYLVFSWEQTHQPNVYVCSLWLLSLYLHQPSNRHVLICMECTTWAWMWGWTWSPWHELCHGTKCHQHIYSILLFWCNLEVFMIVGFTLDRLNVFFINLEEFGVWLYGMLVVKSCCLRLVLIGIHFLILLSLHVIVYLDSIQLYKILLVVRIIHYHEISVVPIFLAGAFHMWKIL